MALVGREDVALRPRPVHPAHKGDRRRGEPDVPLSTALPLHPRHPVGPQVFEAKPAHLREAHARAEQDGDYRVLTRRSASGDEASDFVAREWPAGLEARTAELESVGSVRAEPPAVRLERTEVVAGRVLRPGRAEAGEVGGQAFWGGLCGLQAVLAAP